jgi:hypothetical protein
MFDFCAAVGTRALTLGIHAARHSVNKIANKQWAPIKVPAISKWKLDPFAGARRDREAPLPESKENRGKFEEDLEAYEEDIENAGTVDYLEKRVGLFLVQFESTRNPACSLC